MGFRQFDFEDHSDHGSRSRDEARGPSKVVERGKQWNACVDGRAIREGLDEPMDIDACRQEHGNGADGDDACELPAFTTDGST